MNYELAKKLKEMRFPFKTHHLVVLHMDGSTPDNYPTLSELIEACGDGYFELNKSLIRGNWRAIWGEPTGVKAVIESESKTPEEAVANLWLKLNQSSVTED